MPISTPAASNTSAFKNLLMGSAAFAALAFMPNHAFAANECGVAVAGGTITCNGDGAPVSDVNPYANGISYTIDGQILNVNGAATAITSGTNHGVHLQGTVISAVEINTASTLSITSAGNHTNGIFGDHTGSGAVTVNSSSTISIAAGGGVFGGSGIFARINNAASTSTVVVNATDGTITAGPGGDNRGILAQHLGLGDVTVNSTANISTTGNVGVGIQSTSALVTSSATNTINVNGGTISTTGSTGIGIGILGRSLGSGVINISSTAVITTTGGNSSWGIYGNHQGNGSTTINLTGGSVSTTGNRVQAVFGRNQGSGALLINATGGTISTTNTLAHGIEGRQDGSGDTTIVSVVGITTTGVAARGLYAWTAGAGTPLAQMNGGSIGTTGSSAYGIYSAITNAANTATSTARLTNGTITTGGSGAYGLHASGGGLGAAITRMDGGSIATTGNSGAGLVSFLNGNPANTATVTSLLTNGMITTTGSGAYGLRASHFGLGAAIAQMDNGSIGTIGFRASGVFANISGATNTSSATALQKAGTITTAGGNGLGVFSLHNGLSITLAQKRRNAERWRINCYNGVKRPRSFCPY